MQARLWWIWAAKLLWGVTLAGGVKVVQGMTANQARPWLTSHCATRPPHGFPRPAVMHRAAALHALSHSRHLPASPSPLTGALPPTVACVRGALRWRRRARTCTLAGGTAGCRGRQHALSALRAPKALPDSTVVEGIHSRPPPRRRSRRAAAARNGCGMGAAPHVRCRAPPPPLLLPYDRPRRPRRGVHLDTPARPPARPPVPPRTPPLRQAARDSRPAVPRAHLVAGAGPPRTLETESTAACKRVPSLI